MGVFIGVRVYELEEVLALQKLILVFDEKLI